VGVLPGAQAALREAGAICEALAARPEPRATLTLAAGTISDTGKKMRARSDSVVFALLTLRAADGTKIERPKQNAVADLEGINAELVFRCDSSTRFCNPATEHGGAGRGECHPGQGMEAPCPSHIPHLIHLFYLAVHLYPLLHPLQ